MCLVLVLGFGLWSLAAPPESPKVSQIASAKRLQEESARLLSAIENTMSDEANYKDLAGQVSRDSSTLAVLALALGLHDEENAWKKTAPGIVPAAAALADVDNDYAAAQAAFAKLQAAIKTPAEAEALEWKNVTVLTNLMKQSTSLYNRMKRSMSASRFSKRTDDNAGAAAALAVIGQITLHDTDYVSTDAEIALWQKQSTDWRTAASSLLRAIEAQDLKAANSAMTLLDRSCTECHQALKLDIKE